MTEEQFDQFILNKTFWVTGYIDAYGAIHADVSEEIRSHSATERLSGKRWRWNVLEQDYHKSGLENLTRDDLYRIDDWLIDRHLKIEDATPS